VVRGLTEGEITIDPVKSCTFGTRVDKQSSRARSKIFIFFARSTEGLSAPSSAAGTCVAHCAAVGLVGTVQACSGFSQTGASPTADGVGMTRVLIVEDEYLVALDLQAHLRSRGYNADTVALTARKP